MRQKKLNESVGNGWRGCKDIEVIGHGEWSDPDLYTVIDGMDCYFNYFDIEDALWGDFLEETGHTDKESDDPEVDKEFDKYCQKWAYYYMIDCFNNGYFGNPYEKNEYSNGEFCSWRPSDFDEEEDDDDIDESVNKKKPNKKLKEAYSEEEYRGYTIAYDFYGHGEYTVNYCGDDIVCKTREEAKKTIDELIEYDNKMYGPNESVDKKKKLKESEMRTQDCVDDSQMGEWGQICKAFAKKMGAKLLFVNNCSCGLEFPDGTMKHVYLDEMVDYLKNEGVNLKMKNKKLTEARGWRYSLKSGSALRQAIDAEDYDDVLTQLANCWREINEFMPDNYDESDLENDIDDIENQRDNLENYEEYGMTYEDVTEEIDYLLSQLYDFCDNTRIWVDLD